MKWHLLLVDDDEISIKVSLFMVEEAEFHPTPITFGDGLQARNYLRDAYNTDETFVIFLDINMPVMNGWEFLEEINSFAYPDNVKVFVVSSSVYELDKLRAEESKFVIQFLSKPVLSTVLESLKKNSSLDKLFL